MNKPFNFIPVSVKLQPRIGFDPGLLFDSDWYLKTYPDVAAAGVNPLMHYLTSGGVTGRNPSALFDSAWYLSTYPDVAAAGINPLMHYLTSGGVTGYDPHPLFDSDWYLETYPDVAAAGVNPLMHYLASGGVTGYDPSPLFDSDWYLAVYPDVAAAGLNPLLHFAVWGGSSGRNPSPLFDSDWYLRTYPDVAAAGVNPFVHFVTTGCAEGRLPGSLSESRNMPGVRMAFPYEIGPVPLVQKTLRRVTILIPVHGQWHWTERCLKALALTEAADLAVVVVIDDASKDDTYANMKRFQWAQVRRAPENLGFTKACNFGALDVDTEYILFLNNDTEPLPGFLNSLITCADSESDVGIVGSKLIYADGSLQEAGSIVWKDGSSQNFGKHQNADSYKFRTSRNVDYCSGASILVRTDLFTQIGGFDEQYAPAYYEDVDLSFMARQRGFHTRYEPESVVIHHEGGTHGRDTRRGLKVYQVNNKKKFISKWGQVLENHFLPNQVPQRIASNSRIKARKILLFVDHMFITPKSDAGSLRSFEMLLLCQELGFEVVFSSTVDDPMKESAEELRRAGILVLGSKKELHEFLSEESDFVELVLLSRARTAFSWFNWLLQNHPQIPIAFDTVDLHHVRELELAQLDESDVDEIRSLATKRIELFLLENTDATIVVSDQERNYLRDFSPDANISVVGTIHRVVQNLVPFKERKGILFVGSFQHPPNEDGLRWFFEEVWEHLDPRVKSDGLSIVGKNPPEELVEEAPEGAKFLGWVESTDPYVDSARLSIAPLRFGAGIKGKIGEAWSRGLPVIGTTSAFRGMVDVGTADFHSADDPKAFAELINSVYSSESLWVKASEAGQRRVQETLSRDVAKKALVHLIDSVAR
jgi:GT2 family glycosyltransferase